MENVLTVRNLTKFFGNSCILDNVNLNVRRGEVMGFLGPNGAGKTTAIKTVLGFLSLDGGTVEINGYSTEKNYEEAMASVGGIVENPDMYKQFSGLLNLKMYARTHEGVTDERIAEVVEMVGLTNRINDKVKKYSLGMKQRLGLAQALLHRPNLLLLDEPTNGLDPEGIKELRDILKTVAHRDNVGILVSSHQLAEMQLMCDRITIIEKGRIICEKAINDLRNSESGAGTRFAVSVDNPHNAVAVLEGKNSAVDRETGEVSFDAERDDVPEILKQLILGDVKVYELREIKKSLEDAYIAITNGGAENENA